MFSTLLSTFTADCLRHTVHMATMLSRWRVEKPCGSCYPLVSLVPNLSQLWFLVAQCAKLGGFFQVNDAKVYLGRQTGGGEEVQMILRPFLTCHCSPELLWSWNLPLVQDWKNTCNETGQGPPSPLYAPKWRGVGSSVMWKISHLFILQALGAGKILEMRLARSGCA